MASQVQSEHLVTPHVGVWIETSHKQGIYRMSGVTPHVGVWIETSMHINARRCN